VTGNTVYNMLKLQECEVDQEDRPLYPNKITKTEVCTYKRYHATCWK